MAILSEGDDQYEVRIKRYPDKTYFDEHIKVGDREKPNAQSCERYIVGEEKITYTIELILHKGFNFGKYEFVRMQLWFHGQKQEVGYADACKPYGQPSIITEDVNASLEFATVQMNGLMMKDTRFVFHGLHSGMLIFRAYWLLSVDLSCLDDSLKAGGNQHGLGQFVVKVFKVKFGGVTRRRAPNLNTKELWKAPTVDENSFQKDGIAFSAGYVSTSTFRII
jgi:hypothetical protein